MSPNSEHEQRLWKVMVWGTALSFGFLGAIALSMKDFIHGNASFQFSYLTLVGFAVGFAVGWIFWKFVGKRIDRTKK
jgi:putative Mn2+ efflux pump MntP